MASADPRISRFYGPAPFIVVLFEAMGVTGRVPNGVIFDWSSDAGGMSNKKAPPSDIEPMSLDETTPIEQYGAPWACPLPFLFLDPIWPDETRSRAFQAFPKHDLIDVMVATWH